MVNKKQLEDFYKENLEEVNRNISIIKDYLNDYFMDKIDKNLN